jgi:hypothetical protein
MSLYEQCFAYLYQNGADTAKCTELFADGGCGKGGGTEDCPAVVDIKKSGDGQSVEFLIDGNDKLSIPCTSTAKANSCNEETIKSIPELEGAGGTCIDKLIKLCGSALDECLGKNIKQCYSDKEQKNYNSGDSKCGNCRYDDSSPLQYGSCKCVDSGWVLQMQCDSNQCSNGVCDGQKVDCSKERTCASNDDCAVCDGSGWTCESKTSIRQSKLSGSVLGLSGSIDLTLTSSGDDKICVKNYKETPVGECEYNIIPGTPSSKSANCKSGDSFGVYVPFTIKKYGGNCDGLACSVTNDYDSGAATATRKSDSGTSSGWAACVKPSMRSSSSGTKGSNPDKLVLEINCDVNGANPQSKQTTCDFPENNSNLFDQKEEEASTTQDQANNKNEQDKQDKTAPKVTVSAPSGGATIKDHGVEREDGYCRRMQICDGRIVLRVEFFWQRHVDERIGRHQSHGHVEQFGRGHGRELQI